MGKAARAVRTGVQAEFIKKFESLSGRYSIRQIWEDWVVMSAISISNVVDQVHATEREKHYRTLASKYQPQELLVFSELFVDFVNAMDRNPDQDFLGEMYMAVGMGNEHAGQFFTPYDVCRCMSEIVSNFDLLKAEIEQKGFVSVLDPACGAGALLVAFANDCLRKDINYQTSVLFVAQDIDYLVGCMCYLQLSILGCAGYVKIGDSLANPTTFHDPRGLIPCDGGNIWYTPFYFREEWHTRRLAASMALLFSKLPTTEKAEELPAEAAAAPLQPLPAPEAPAPPVTISPEPEPPVEAEETAYNENKYGQLMFF